MDIEGMTSKACLNMISIRFATPDDAAELLDIYRPYVTDTAITFEYEVPSVAEFRERIVNIQKKYPYIVAVQESTSINGYDANPEHDNKLGRIVGYAYAGAFKNRAAYDRAVEMTVYVNKDCQKSGIGRKLYDEMERILKKMNVINVNACIGYPTGDDDEHLTRNSAEFHAHMGYSMVGKFHKCGYKLGRWYDMVWMEKMIGDHQDKPKPFISVKDIQDHLQ